MRTGLTSELYFLRSDLGDQTPSSSSSGRGSVLPFLILLGCPTPSELGRGAHDSPISVFLESSLSSLPLFLPGSSPPLTLLLCFFSLWIDSLFLPNHTTNQQ
ncbi:hypothetical protein Scep_004176 [Stephania cephalantha]|uniref:Uncharacterized protein n=1 Tax=Stephania cephalantha TaxID=152367 RepID=A0AAP0KRY5_9MAGN